MPPPATLAGLRGGEVHVWVVELEALPSMSPAALLSPAEAERAARFVHERDGRRYARGRAALRRILGSYLDMPPEAVPIVAAAHGKPALGGEAAASGLSFNASGSEGLALVALALDVRVGVDVERVRPIEDLEGVARLALSRREQDAFARVPAEERLESFHALWVRKEAYVKGIGLGLLRPLERIECIVRSDGADGIRDADDPDAERVWRLAAWRPAEGFHAAVAAEASLAKLLISTYVFATAEPR